MELFLEPSNPPKVDPAAMLQISQEAYDKATAAFQQPDTCCCWWIALGLCILAVAVIMHAAITSRATKLFGPLAAERSRRKHQG